MTRAAWNGSISFGLVQIPVELYAADESRELSFHMLDKRDLAPVGYERINKKTGETVPYDETVKGYEHAKGKYVLMTTGDFVRANVKATQTIDIQAFVPLGRIPPAYFVRPYHVKPKKQAAKAFAVLQAALLRSGRAGIATLVLHTRQHLAAVIAEKDALLLELLRFPDEIRAAKEIGGMGKTAEVSSREQAMAQQLIDGMSADWDPSQYHDVYREDLLKLIQKKAAAGQINQSVEEDEAPPVARPRREGVVDLVALLRKSIEQRPASSAPAQRTAARRTGAGRGRVRAIGQKRPGRLRHTA